MEHFMTKPNEWAQIDICESPDDTTKIAIQITIDKKKLAEDTLAQLLASMKAPAEPKRGRGPNKPKEEPTKAGNLPGQEAFPFGANVPKSDAPVALAPPAAEKTLPVGTLPGPEATKAIVTQPGETLTKARARVGAEVKA